ncbi:MAG TPA: tRNA dihydrouridine synthase DusB [Aggregatilineaceae bacterium]|nr:tRNA dihydrouridine synthase DusB [Aggregatilineaceae bacterium]
MIIVPASSPKFLTPLRIGGVCIDPPLMLAPMAGRSTHALRQLCREGSACGLVTTELLSSRAMQHPSSRERTFELFDWTPVEYPIAVQLFGADPQEMADAARIVEAAGATIVDINVGCWVPKIARKSSAGAALLKDVNRASAVIEAVVSAVHIPVTVKIRSGWESGNPSAIPLAEVAEAVGVAAITVHARFADQGFQGEADWSYIRRVKEVVQRIPIIGNGDVSSAADVRRMMTETECDGVMIGRAALGRPWLFRQIAHELRTGQVLPDPTLRDRAETVLRHTALTMQSTHQPPHKTFLELRGQLLAYFHDLPPATPIREAIVRVKSVEDIERALAPWLASADC